MGFPVMTKKKPLALAAAAGLAAAVLVAPAPAMASSVSCSTGASSGYCESVYLNSNYTGRFMDWRVCGGVLGANWRVRDYTGSRVVGSGTVGIGSCRNGRINGLYSIYRIEIHGGPYGSSGVLDND